MSIQKNSSVTACIFSKDKKKVLLIKRRDVPVWVLPGGGIEDLESPETAILREIKEETGLDTQIIRKVGEYIPINRLTRYTYLFECQPLSGHLQISDETKDVKFFSIHTLPKMPPPYEDWINDGKMESSIILKKKLSQVTYCKFVKNLFFHPILVIRFLLSRIGKSINT